MIATNRLSYGPFSKRFESLFSGLHDCRHSIFCNSGTSALHIALATLKERYGWVDGDEVIVPAVTFIATSNIVLHNNLTPIFVDVRKDTYNINPDLIKEKITNKCRAIIPVHLFGLPCDMDPILELAQKYGLKVIEDSCETMMATYKEKKVGSFGDIGCFSTYIAHIITTGIGGIATTNDDDNAVFLRSLMNHGRDSIYLNMDDDKKKTGDELFKVVSARFKFIHVGHSFRATELEAAIGLGQLERIEEIISARKSNARYLMKGLRDIEDRIQLPTVPSDRDHVFMMFPIVVRKGGKEGLVRHLEMNNVETRDMVPLLNQPIYQKLFGDIEDDYPVAKWINESGFYIGCHQYLTEMDLDYMIATIHEYFEQSKSGREGEKIA